MNRHRQRSASIGFRETHRSLERAVVARYLSSVEQGAGPSAVECARCISELSRSDLSGSLARHLSPSARKEIVDARRRVLSAKDNEQTDQGGHATDSVGGTAEEATPEPSKSDLRLVVINQSIPFVGFGFMDNSILILAGDAIDMSLGVTLGISTLCAAAIGNIISDLAGVGLGAAIEDFASKLNIPRPNLNQAQRQLRSVRFAGQFGCAIGLTIGCIIGMFPLLFIDSRKAEKMKEEAHIESMFYEMVTEAKRLIGAEASCLYTVVNNTGETLPPSYGKRNEARDGNYLYGTYITDSGSAKHAYVPVDRGIVSQAAKSGRAINVTNAKSHADFHYQSDVMGPIPRGNVKDMLCVPVFDAHGNVIAVIKAINKIGKGSISSSNDWKGGGFTQDDVGILRALATHVSCTLKNLNDEENVSLRDTMKILEEHNSASPLDDGPK